MPVIRQVLFIQGGGERVHDDWDAKLVASLRAGLGQNYEVLYPRMPNEDDPRYAAWATAIAHALAGLGESAILVGHSIGGTILINALAEHSPERAPGAIVLISAPYVGEGGWPSDDWTPERELGGKLPSGVPIHLFFGLADATVPASHAELYARAIPQADLHRVPGRDHQFNDDLSEVAAVIRSLVTKA